MKFNKQFLSLQAALSATNVPQLRTVEERYISAGYRGSDGGYLFFLLYNFSVYDVGGETFRLRYTRLLYCYMSIFQTTFNTLFLPIKYKN